MSSRQRALRAFTHGVGGRAMPRGTDDALRAGYEALIVPGTSRPGPHMGDDEEQKYRILAPINPAVGRSGALELVGYAWGVSERQALARFLRGEGE